MEDDRLIHLLELYLDGGLSAAQKDEFERELLQSARSRRLFWEHTSLHGLMHEAATLKWADAAQEVEHKVEKRRPERSPGVLAWIRNWPGPGWGWKLAGATGALAAILVLLALGTGLFQRSVATISLAQDVEWADSARPVMAGATLKPGPLRLINGSIQLNFKNGAQVVFESPAEIELVSHDRLFCRTGRFWVHAPPSARGFELATATFAVEDMGTEFGLSAPPDGLPEVHVFTGHVAVERFDTPSKFVEDLLENEAVAVTSTNLASIPVDRSGFLSSTELAHRQLPETQSKHEMWLRVSESIDADPAAILHFTFQEEPYWSRIATNQAVHGLNESNGRIMGATWSVGRWAGKKSLVFTNLNDRIRVSMPQRFRAFTSFAWVRVDGLPNTFIHSLISGVSEEPGTVRWTIHHDGKLRFGFANASNTPQASWNVGMSPSVIKKELFGQWTMLALVFDGTNGTHYVNGEPVWTGAMRGPEDAFFGRADVGNWEASPDHPDFQWAKNQGTHFFTRRFVGAMDEIGVLTRPLSPEEIQELYEAGRPLEPAQVATAETDRTEVP